VVSEDIDELYSISDRICAICDGELSPVAPTHDVSINQLGLWMAGDFHASSDEHSSTEVQINAPEASVPKDRGAMKSC
jgi:simple sugar transport system ATP-binding protein